MFKAKLQTINVLMWLGGLLAMLGMIELLTGRGFRSNIETIILGTVFILQGLIDTKFKLKQPARVVLFGITAILSVVVILLIGQDLFLRFF